MRHKGRFRPPRPSAGYGFSKETFTVGRGKEEEAPIAALPVIRSSSRRGREFVGGELDGGGSANRII